MSKLEDIAGSGSFTEKLETYCEELYKEEVRCPLYVDLVNSAISLMEKEGLTTNELGFMACVNHATPVRGSRSKRTPGTVDVKNFSEITEPAISEQEGCSKQNPAPLVILSPDIGSVVASTSSTKRQLSGDEGNDSELNTKQEADGPEDPVLQCADYATNMFNRGGIRLHVIGTLITDGNMELLLYTRSGTASASFSFIHDRILFLRILLASSRMSLSQWGMFNTLIPRTLDQPRLPLEEMLQPDRGMFSGQTFETDGTWFEAMEVAMFPRGLISRGTWALLVKVVNGRLVDDNVVSPGEELFMKISCIASTRPKEGDYIDIATKAAQSNQAHVWVLDHLPKVLATDEFTPKVSFDDLFGDKLERRDLRYVIVEKLYPITELKGLAFGTAFKDIIRCHQWLIEVAKIMHRDVSLNNLLYRKKEGRTYGVLNDYDLACSLDKPEEPTSRQRTGTKPFIAMDLLAKPSLKDELAQHRAQFDLESFYWMKGSWEDVRAVKSNWLQSSTPSLTATYNQFRAVLLVLKEYVSGGLHRLAIYKSREELHRLTGNDAWKLPPFDFETLDGNITYTKFISAFDLML
ncbi:hypothetical protein AAF712_004795 [Marasmius tenuissimus]|uniref:Fungal-type protein kinase domain-containing protein n=1 Tax=Marasmius tenuissimus TaxID=585030 RepID=A0ABR3A3Q7_9AGAR